MKALRTNLPSAMLIVIMLLAAVLAAGSVGQGRAAGQTEAHFRQLQTRGLQNAAP